MSVEMDKTLDGVAKQLSGAIRHLNWLTCPINAFAFYLFYRFHVMGEPFPSFAARESWYNIKLLISKKSMTKPVGDTSTQDHTQARTKAISYNTHNGGIKSVFEACNINLPSTTHAGRKGGTQHAELNNVPEVHIRSAGGWNNRTVMESVYLNKLPRQFMRGLAGFNPAGGSYFLPRATHEPPDCIKNKIFPEADRWYDLHSRRRGQDRDLAAQAFLTLLIHLRTVICQDVCILRKLFPENVIAKHHIFNNFFDKNNVLKVDEKEAWETFEASTLEVQESSRNPCSQTLTDAAPSIAEAINNLHRDLMHAQTTQNHELLEVLESIDSQLAAVQARMVTAGNILIGDNNTGGPTHSAPPPASSQPSSQSSLILPSLSMPPMGSNASTATDATIPRPNYRLSRATTSVEELYQEWTVGINHGPSVQSLNDKHGSSWRSDPKERQYYYIRKAIMDELFRLCNEEGLTTQQAISRLEAMRNGKGIHNIHKQLIARQTNRGAEEAVDSTSPQGQDDGRDGSLSLMQQGGSASEDRIQAMAERNSNV